MSQASELLMDADPVAPSSPNVLTRENQPPTECYIEPVVYCRRDENGNTMIDVRDRLTGGAIKFGGVTAAIWQFGLLKGQSGEPDQVKLRLSLDNPPVVEES